jgi:hypothetical protein
MNKYRNICGKLTPYLLLYFTASEQPPTQEEFRKKRPSLPPPPIPPFQSSPPTQASPLALEASIAPADEAGWVAGGKAAGGSGWSSATVGGRRDSGTFERPKSRGSVILSHSTSLSNLANLAQDPKFIDTRYV